MWLNHYLLIRHTPNGRKYPFLDCWGLVREFHRRELGIELDECTDFSIRDGYENVTSQNSFREIKAETAEFGDVLAFFRHGLIFHVGVYLGRGEMLHTGLNRHCRVEKVRTMQFVETRIYRHCHLLERKNET
ncbi:MAG: C40 family peptidase [Ruminobacter sp.]|uniref:NlpC/P60 family protein n=1 Tax=Ruminobacter sp. TaxID=2774296 RepID=UPI002580DE7B|nr:NlpC/P60 family protein [Ruminobacter sp.]MBQ3776099.1 C40 family peptidase [Ruminobacter sp.]